MEHVTVDQAMMAVTAESCPACGTETPHQVGITIVEETTGEAYSRQPYRKALCSRCGAEQTRRMNDA